MQAGLNFDGYEMGTFYDEMFEAPGVPRPGTKLLLDKLRSLPPNELLTRQAAAEKVFFDLGITFSVYGHEQGTEKIFPFDIVPRVIEAREWNILEQGLKQRIQALNLFLDDIYHDQKILQDKVVPRDIIETSAGYFPACQGLNPPLGVWCHITGTDLIRDENGEFHVLEDNLRSPSGVSYVLANRQVLKRTLPQVFSASNVRSVDTYPSQLLEMLHSIAPLRQNQPSVALLTPGVYNSAYFEHSFLSQQTGIELVEGADLVVHDGYVHMRTTKGLIKVDVIYRRIGEDFLDPQVFRPDSLLGVPGIMEVYRQGRVALANAPGTGVADDKAVYAYVPAIIKYYLDEDPIIPNVPTYICRDPKQMEHVLANLDSLVVKAANESGGYGMLIGPASTKAEQEDFAAKIRHDPRNYIAQPTISLSRCPVIVGDHFEGRHVDLRPYVLYGNDIQVIPGGLTRVALTKGSLVVNSSQGGGSKDTWVLGR
ncbi:circularly permuted type 2 ATP-grasp protein [Desulfonatronum thioautotrophicum]|uniref:circularly permuted type 2 ATP-grasp protein n=1 Tax=Desulfonatronum thioautotrophicum TaxID=617001 RepID=UPI0005EB28BE|nr:circularly permuted type 2 ATP-grasp protein [Desulfonatronum thioautotrophicum]